MARSHCGVRPANFAAGGSGRGVGREIARPAVAELEDALEGAEGELARLGAAVRNKFRADAAALAVWERARRLERAPARKGAGGDGAGDAAPGRAPK